MQTTVRLLLLSLCLAQVSAHAAGGRDRAAFVLLTEDYPPYNMVNDHGKIGGMATEAVRELFARAGLSYRIELQPWLRAFNTAQQQPHACVYSTVRTAERETRFKWIGPLAESTWALYGGPWSPEGVTSLVAARRSVIGGYGGDAEAQYLVRHGFNLQLASADELNLRKLMAGRIDFWAASKARGAWLLYRHRAEGIRLVLTFESVGLFLACNRSLPDADVQRLNGLLEDMRREGFFERMRRRYPAG